MKRVDEREERVRDMWSGMGGEALITSEFHRDSSCLL
jgi:hypothetical protein